jgi:hypothetical protein
MVRRSLTIGSENLQITLITTDIPVINKEFFLIEQLYAFALMKNRVMRWIDTISSVDVSNAQERVQSGAHQIHLVSGRVRAEKSVFVDVVVH